MKKIYNLFNNHFIEPIQDKNVKLNLIINRPYYVAGNDLECKINVQSNKPIPYKNFKLDLIGCEMFSNSSISFYKFEYFIPIIDHYFNHSSDENQCQFIDPGEYSINSRFRLDEYLPNTIDKRNYNLKYYLISSLQIENINEIKIIRDVKEVFIFEKFILNSNNSWLFSKVFRQNLKKLDFPIEVSAFLEKAVFTSGSNVEINIEIKNQINKKVNLCNNF